MELEFRCVEGNDAHNCAMLMANFGKVEKFFRATNLHSALKSIARRGWKYFAAIPSDGDSWRVIVARPKQ